MPKRRRRAKRAGGDPRRLLLWAAAVAAAGLFLSLHQGGEPVSPRHRRAARPGSRFRISHPSRQAQVPPPGRTAPFTPTAGRAPETSERQSRGVPRLRGQWSEEQEKQPHIGGVPRLRGAVGKKSDAAQARHSPTRQRHPLERAPLAGVHPGLAAAPHAAPPSPTPDTQHPTPSAELDRGPTTRRDVALTFDAGSSPAPTPAILRALQAAHLHCTFFLTGEWTAHNPALVRRIAAEGHELGNHTYTHPDLRRLSDAAVARELERTDALVRRLTGRGTRPYFRPPFGARNPRVLRDVARHGYRCVYWTTDSLDSVRQGITPRQIERRILTRVHPGSIILMHCGSAASAAALPHLLTALHRKGYRVVTISQLMRAGQTGPTTEAQRAQRRSF